ncbi:class II D-tagatose-bisphosphate aldolase non-catalytic subunit [Tropicimonas sp. IMCC34043]|uniref:class II D-tagatose-bisphosphate aldolase non-catalytic subunit n=1 Tax=Tropicimonas sp. IMCC34043 TaxID=2248760 RepID=UPI000E229FD9|nr:class II D-tagatose-bisphosphate aldolase, non-catalytic subunit [Tropicimonas sp. IMCC34043]
MTQVDFATGVARNLAGEGFAFGSVCSAHPDVLAACLRLAADRGAPIMVEATSNQVNQFGGYTGMTPADFIDFARGIAGQVGYPAEAITFGGDHLGPQAWRSAPAEEAMEKARAMIAAYVQAGFTKIHLDCSEGCAGEPAQLGDGLAAARAADLAEVAEKAAPDPERICYVVGTEVPPPGGARTDEDHVVPTDPLDAAHTLQVTRNAFLDRGLTAAWGRVHGLVVQPGLEFAPAHVHAFDIRLPDLLWPALGAHPGIAFEAHSTDYQAARVYPDLARRHFAVLKVGPALTFALREALYALSHIDRWLGSDAPHLSEVMERLMQADPSSWQGHYHGNAGEQFRLRHFGYADRIRYYWAQPEAQSAVASLRKRIDAQTLLLPMLAQYFPACVLTRADALRTCGLSRSAALIHANIEAAFAPYLDVLK